MVLQNSCDFSNSFASGALVLPLQPSFAATISATISNVTGDGTLYSPIAFDSEIYDRTGAYNNSTYLYVAPQSGVHLITLGLWIGGLTVAHTEGQAIINIDGTSAAEYYPFDLNLGAVMTPSNYVWFCNSVLAYMTAGDTCKAELYVANGTKVVDLTKGGGTGQQNIFAAHFLG